MCNEKADYRSESNRLAINWYIRNDLSRSTETGAIDLDLVFEDPAVFHYFKIDDQKYEYYY